METLSNGKKVNRVWRIWQRCILCCHCLNLHKIHELSNKVYENFVDFSCKFERSVNDARFMQFSCWLTKVSSIHQRLFKVSIFKDLQIETNLHKIIGDCKTRMWENWNIAGEIEADLHLIKLSNEINQTVRISTATFYWQSIELICVIGPQASASFLTVFIGLINFFEDSNLGGPFFKLFDREIEKFFIEK